MLKRHSAEHNWEITVFQSQLSDPVRGLWAPAECHGARETGIPAADPESMNFPQGTRGTLHQQVTYMPCLTDSCVGTVSLRLLCMFGVYNVAETNTIGE